MTTSNPWAMSRAYRPSTSIEPALARNGAQDCEWKYCNGLRRGLGRFCGPHAYTRDRTGHPVALHIPRMEWAPFVQEAEAFVLDQLRAGHSGIEAGIRWVASELVSAEMPTNPRRVHLAYQSALLRARRSGVSPSEFLARVVAGELADDRGEPRPRFASDEHADHQRARLFLMMRPFGPEGWTKRHREPQGPREVKISFGVRAYTFNRLREALGLLALKAAAAIQAHR